MNDVRIYPKVRLNQPWDLQARAILNNAMAGKLNVLGELILDPGVEATMLEDPLITQASVIVLMPMTANAAAALQDLHFQPTATGSAVINHANNGQTDRRFRYAVFG